MPQSRESFIGRRGCGPGLWKVTSLYWNQGKCRALCWKFPAEVRMITASEKELALSMMRLWGKDAKYRARDYALDFWRKGDAPAYNRWHRVERIVELSQTAPVPYAGTVSGLYARPKPRRRWYELPLEAIMPAIRRLGSSAMRGTGL
jgi:hypothetical protein